jgi:hypothetical protein
MGGASGSFLPDGPRLDSNAFLLRTTSSASEQNNYGCTTDHTPTEGGREGVECGARGAVGRERVTPRPDAVLGRC